MRMGALLVWNCFGILADRRNNGAKNTMCQRGRYEEWACRSKAGGVDGAEMITSGDVPLAERRQADGVTARCVAAGARWTRWWRTEVMAAVTGAHTHVAGREYVTDHPVRRHAQDVMVVQLCHGGPRGDPPARGAMMAVMLSALRSSRR